jgi:hypothetical protein
MESMNRGRRRVTVPILVSVAAALVVGLALIMTRAQASPGNPVAVSGEGVHFFTTAIAHSQEPTESGMIQRSSDIVTLSGDLEGHILYHATSTFDFAAGTLVNTGSQMFSGTILGSDPVILHDDRFVFEVDLATGATIGEVYLGRSKDAPHPGWWWECDLDVVGTGLTEDGDATVVYTGECRRMGRP